MKIELKQTYNAPAKKVFAAFTDVENITKIIPAIKKVEILEGESPVKVGTKWRETREMFGKEAVEEMQVTKIDPAKLYVVETYSNGTKYVVTHTFEEQDGVTTVDILFDAQPQTFTAKMLSVLAFLVAGQTKKMLQEDMDVIKSYVEAEGE